jgi:hypothetical protein
MLMHGIEVQSHLAWSSTGGMSMKRYEHTITVHTMSEILDKARSTSTAPPVVYCDTEGACFFDDAPNPYVEAIVELLDERGGDGWELVQVVPRAQDIICFWRRGAKDG